MIQNIILICIIIVVIFFVSGGNKINDIISKKHFKFLIILLIIFFIYQNYNFAIFVVILLIFIFFNMDNNKYLDQTNMLNNLNEIFLSFKNFIDKKENFDNENDDYEVKPFKEEKVVEDKIEIEEKPKIEPFRDEVKKLKNLYENIKEEMKKIK